MRLAMLECAKDGTDAHHNLENYPTLLGSANWKLVASQSDSALKASEEKSKNASDDRATSSNRKPSKNENRQAMKKKQRACQTTIPNT